MADDQLKRTSAAPDGVGKADAADRHRLVVAATAATAARDREVFGNLIRQTSELLATYTDDQLAVIDDFLTRPLCPAMPRKQGSGNSPGARR